MNFKRIIWIYKFEGPGEDGCYGLFNLNILKSFRSFYTVYEKQLNRKLVYFLLHSVSYII